VHQIRIAFKKLLYVIGLGDGEQYIDLEFLEKLIRSRVVFCGYRNDGISDSTADCTSQQLFLDLPVRRVLRENQCGLADV
jgi:hypothetical protein